MPRKKKIEEEKKEPLEVTYIYHEGDNLPEIAKAITGHSYLMGALLFMNGKNMNDLKEGDILKWK